MRVPFVDLKVQYLALKSEMDAAIQSVIDESAFIRGKFVKRFEEAYAAEYGVECCISCGNGTDAIYAVLRALGVGPGDEVITVANSWISTSETIGQTGARPVFVDVDEYFTIDVTKIEEKITPKTKAVIPVHLYGQPCDMDAVMEICGRHGLACVEDCAQAHFATYKGKRVGTFGAAGTFSFYPGKNLGAYGDAGAVVSDDDDLARRVRVFVNHGSDKKHAHEIEGVNSRLDGIQAAVLSVKLPHIHDWNRARNGHGLALTEKLRGVGDIVVPAIRPEAFHVFHICCVMTDHREALKGFLEERGVSASIHYPRALPFQEAYGYQDNKPEDFPVAHANQDRILSLPLFPELTEEMIDYTVDAIKEFFAG